MWCVCVLIILSIRRQMFALSLLCVYLCKTCDVCDVFSTAQRIVGQNGQKNMLACILQYLPRCSRTIRDLWRRGGIK